MMANWWKYILIFWLLSFLTGCLQQPFTKVGAIGYHNQGFEKQLEGSGRILLDEQGRPTAWLLYRSPVH